MSGIVCAVRGGPGSEATVEQGILAAQKSELPLYFLHVLNLDFLMQAPQSQLGTLSQEMMEEGEFIMLTAQTRAQEQGLRAHGLVRTGDIREQIYTLCRELDADYVLLGRPSSRGGANELSGGMMEELRQRIERETNSQFLFSTLEESNS
jgi:nucleotide-binding universal stress UspA family protein